jgi:hypothetical protein
MKLTPLCGQAGGQDVVVRTLTRSGIQRILLRLWARNSAHYTFFTSKDD